MRSRIQLLRAFLRSESGAAEIIAVIVLVAIAILLAIAFREQISELLTNIWGAVRGRESELTSELEL